MTTSTVPPTINYTKRQFQDVFTELRDFIQATRPDDFTDFFSSNLGVAIIELNAYVADLISYGQDIIAQEIYLATARRYDSVLRFARSVGYVPRSATAATATLKSTGLPASVVTNGGVVPAGTFIDGLNGLRYEVVDEQTIPPGSSIASINVKEGASFTETFTPTKAAGQTFQVARGIVEDSSWEIFVGDPDDSTNLWTQVDNVLFETTASETYEVFFDGDGKLSIRFGNGNAGKIPNQTITVRYRTTTGRSGNTAINTISGNLRVDVLQGSIVESVAVANSDNAASGGQDRETVDELRVNIPTFLRSLDKVITGRDYDENVAQQGGVALAFSDVPLASYNGNIVRVHIWDEEQVDFSVTSSQSGVTSSVKYNRYAVSSGTRVNAVQGYLAPRTMVTVHNIVLASSIAQVDLNLGLVFYDRLNDRNVTHERLVQAMVDLFEESSGFEIRLADLYRRGLAVPGIRHFQIESIAFEAIDPTNPPNIITTNYHRDPPNNPGTLPLQDLVILGAVNRVFYDDALLYTNEITYSGSIEDTAVQAINLRTLDFTLQA